MNKLELMLIRKALKPTVSQKQDGSIIFSFTALRLLPADAPSRLHYAADALGLYPGVSSAYSDTENASVIVECDPSSGLTVPEIRAWFEAAMDLCLGFVSDPKNSETINNESLLTEALSQRLGSFLPRYLQERKHF